MILSAGRIWLTGCRAGWTSFTGSGVALSRSWMAPDDQSDGKACRRVNAAVTSLARGHRPAERIRVGCEAADVGEDAGGAVSVPRGRRSR